MPHEISSITYEHIEKGPELHFNKETNTFSFKGIEFNIRETLFLCNEIPEILDIHATCGKWGKLAKHPDMRKRCQDIFLNCIDRSLLLLPEMLYAQKDMDAAKVTAVTEAIGRLLTLRKEFIADHSKLSIIEQEVAND